ncbi:MAG: hypothetical protein JWN70_5692 [Planctomycetaceae bacterium]|nr:hypothetical protein [Planctomycetaceae bacterium]
MELLEADEQYLVSRGLNYEVIADGEGLGLVFKNFPLSPGKYDREVTDLLICIPKGYNNAKLDNFYLDPPVRLKATGQYPDRGDVFEPHAGRTWQRLSRHLPKWRAGIDTLRSFLPFAEKELQDKG